jgi:hypothetical protein
MICVFAPESALVLKPQRISIGALHNCDITPDGTLPRDRLPATKMSCGGKVSVGGVPRAQIDHADRLARLESVMDELEQLAEFTSDQC